MPEVWNLDSIVHLDGRVDLLATGTAAVPGVWWLPQSNPGQVGWSGNWRTLGAPPAGPRDHGRVSAARNADGRLEAAAAGSDGALWHLWQDLDGQWSAWSTLGTPPGLSSQCADPALAVHVDGRVAVFTMVAGVVWTRRQEHPGDPTWSAWEQVGDVADPAGSAERPVVAQWEDGRLQVFVLAGSSLRFAVESRTAVGEWSGWRDEGLPPHSRQPLVTSILEGLVVMVYGGGGATAMFRSLQSPDGAFGSWSNIQQPSPSGFDFEVRDMAMAANADSRPLVIGPYRSNAGTEEVWLAEPESAHPEGSWLGRSLGKHPSPEFSPGRLDSPTLAVDADGRLVAAFRMADSTHIYMLLQQDVNGTVWLNGEVMSRPPA